MDSPKRYVIKRDAPRKYLVNYRADLNDEQYSVVTAGTGPLLVIAGAGSGKTRTVTYRVARLIESGIAPSRILLVTFTNKASREMLRRVESLVQSDVRKIWGGTFHSIANRILRRHAVSLDYQANFTILDSEDAKDLLEASIQEAGIDPKAKRFPKAEVINGIISFANNTDLPIRDCLIKNYPQFEPLATQIERVDRLYQARKLERNAMDYDDLLLNWKRLLTEKKEISDYWAEQFEYILVDEYQDTNKIQAEIIDLLAVKHRNVMVVGDDAQCLLPDSKILTEAKEIKLKDINEKDKVIAASGFGSTGIFQLIEKMKRQYEGTIISIKTKGGRALKLTPEHICYARLQPKEMQWYVYLMYRADKGYRIGITRGIRHPGKTEVNGLMVRANQERADKMWIVLTTSLLAEARFYEELLSIKYGIPKTLFYSLKREPMVFQQEHIDRLYKEIDTFSNAERLMEDFLLFEEYPHFRPQAITSEMSDYYPGRCQAYLIQFGDSRLNIILPWHAHRVRVTTANQEIQNKFQTNSIAMRADKNSKRVETSRKHFSEALELAQKLGKTGEIEICKLSRLTKEKKNFSWQPASHLREGMLLPIIEEGKVKTDEIISVDMEFYKGDVYDLNIENVNNFVANGIVVHNSIFGWRGAHFQNIYEFKERYRDAQEFHLDTNYRSRPEIVMLANASIKNNRKQFPKNLRAIRKSTGLSPAMIPTHDVDQQAAFVASRILELREEGIKLSEIAVLYRSHYHALELQLELTRRDIPYVVRSGIRFFEQAHIKDVVCYLRLLVNPHDEIAWKRVLKLIPQVGNATANRIWERIAYANEPLALVRRDDFEAAPRSREGWRDFTNLIEQLINPENLDKPASQIGLILANGYDDYLQNTYENSDLRAEDLRQLANYAVRFNSTEEFLSELALINTERFATPQGTTAEDVVAGGSEDEDEKLVLSSVHQAKGLEWRAVFLIWAADGKFPSARSLRDAENEEEERRLFYVAITRAQDELYICYPLVVTDYSRQTVIQKPSRFITENPRELFEIWSLEEESLELQSAETPKLIN
jgi:DNA helicase II / ATP-dependent DNA helicase PcrA